MTEDIFEKVDCGPWWKRIIFSLCFFNAVINERKVYGTLGWNIPYKFNSSDLEVSRALGGRQSHMQRPVMSMRKRVSPRC